MKPHSGHWADICAANIVRAKPDQETYVVASGITPSGRVHFGNFREVITVDLVARGLRKLGRKVRFIYSWDNFDTFRKVPQTVPDRDNFAPYLKQAIARIPDPWGQAGSYAEGRIRLFESELGDVGIAPEFRYQEEQYASGTYAEGIRQALESRDQIAAILNQHRSSPLGESWLPTSVYCSACKMDQTNEQEYLGEWNFRYKCSCGHEEEFDIRESKNIKLLWRVDWPMRWAYEKVDFEPGGKDHSSQGGSYDTGKEIVAKVWGRQAPIYLQYDFVGIKGQGGKMSSSSGENITLGEVLKVVEPQMVRWIFAHHRPNHDFKIAFDEDIIKLYEEFDRAEKQAFTSPEKPNGKWLGIKRAYEFSKLEDEDVSGKTPVRVSFRTLCNYLQICDGDQERVFERFYKDVLVNEQDKKRFYERVGRAWYWLENFAPDEFCYRLNSEPVKMTLSSLDKSVLKALCEIVVQTDFSSVSTEDVNTMIYDRVIRATGADPKDAFKLIYQKLISRDRGPRLPTWIQEIEKERLLLLLGE